MKPKAKLFKHYSIELVGPKGNTTLRFRTEEAAAAFKKAIVYSQVYSDYRGVYTNDIYVEYLSIKAYDI